MSDNPGQMRAAGRPVKKATLQDVADACGLSKSIVAQVMRNDERCRASERTRAMIQAMAEQLAYLPDLQAKGIATRKTYLLGVLANTSIAHNFSQLVSGIQSEAAGEHYSVVYYAPSTGHENEREAIEQAMRRQVDVLIIAPRDDGKTNAELLLEVHRGRTKVVQLLYQLSSEMPSITVDYRQVAYDTTRHLIKLGHRRILHINYGHCVKGWAVENDGNWQKLMGYKQAMEEAGLEPMCEACPSVRPSSLESLYVRAGKMLASKPTAVVVMNGSGAYGLVAGLLKIGIAVPEAVSVAGIEDDYAINQCFFQQLSVARLDFEAIGRSAAKMSFGLLGGESVADLVLRPSFEERQTTGPAAG